MKIKSFFFPKLFRIVSIISLLALGFIEKDAENWLQFRGPGSNGIAPMNVRPPIDFGIGKNVKWKHACPEGHSSPCIINDNLIITGIVPQEKKYLIQNLNSHDGAMKWQKEILVDTLETLHPVNSPAVATPVSDGTNIFCYFPPMGLKCFDLDGNEIWRTKIDFYSMTHGSGTSPILVGD